MPINVSYHARIEHEISASVNELDGGKYVVLSFEEDEKEGQIAIFTPHGLAPTRDWLAKLSQAVSRALLELEGINSKEAS